MTERQRERGDDEKRSEPGTESNIKRATEMAEQDSTVASRNPVRGSERDAPVGRSRRASHQREP